MAMAEKIGRGLPTPHRGRGLRLAPRGRPRHPASSPGDGAGDEVRWIYYTSGTTSDPKGVRHTDTTLVTGGRGLAMAVRADARATSAPSPFPSPTSPGPTTWSWCSPSGFPAVLLESFVPAVAVERLHAATGSPWPGAAPPSTGLPQRAAQAAGDRRSSRRCASPGGGAPMPPEIFYEVGPRDRRGRGPRLRHDRDPHDRHGVAVRHRGATGQHRGQARSSAPTSASSPSRRTIAAAGVDGEVRVQGAMVCKGYTDPVMTRRGLRRRRLLPHRRRRPPPARRPCGAHRAAQGHHHPQGREHLGQGDRGPPLHHPKVGDVAVIGLPDRERGERVCAVVETAPGAEPLTFDEMVAHLRARRAHDPEGARAARGGRRPAPQRDPEQGAQVQAARGAGGQAFSELIRGARTGLLAQWRKAVSLHPAATGRPRPPVGAVYRAAP